MFRCLVACGTEPTPGARAQEAARLISQFVGDLCVVALASDDRRSFGPFAVQARDEQMTAMMQQAVDGSARERAAWPLAGRALVSGEPVVIDRIRPGELEGIVNPAMDGYLGHYGLSAMAFVAMRGEHGKAGVIGIGRGPGRPAYTRDEVAAVQRIADAVAEDTEGEPGSLLPLLLIDGALGPGGQTERRFTALVERLPAIVYEAEPGVQGLWLYVSGFVETLLGYTPEEWMADPTLWARSLHEDDRDAVLAAEDRLTAGERIAIEYRMYARDGSLVWVRDESARVLDEQGRLLVEGLLTDITERKAAEDRLQHLADHDALTDLLNRRRFLEELELEVAATKRGMRSSAAIVLDVDGFKFVNDSFGHQAGDELIRTVARTLAAADMAMYEAKRAGRDRVVRFTEQLRDEDGELCGPEAFLGVADRFDLTEAIDRWVLRRALALQREPAGAALCLAVNVSARSIGPAVIELLEREIAAAGDVPTPLILEVTESAAIADLQQARAFAEALERLGLRMSLDDFGAGLGSFSSLRALPVDYLKIDGQFVAGLAGNPVDREIVKAIVGLARAAGRRTVAEFVSDQDTLELLAELGVDLAQGFHVGRPRPLEEL